MVLPLPALVPQHDAPEYHCHVAPAESVPFTESVTCVPEQMLFCVTLAATGAFGEGTMVTVTLSHVETQEPFSARRK